MIDMQASREWARWGVTKCWETPVALPTHAIGITPSDIFRRVSMSAANCSFRVVFTLHKPIQKFPVIGGVPCRFA